MYLLTNVYYWASAGCPDAVPAGLLAFSLGLNETSHDDVEEADAALMVASNLGLLDSACEDLGFVGSDIDLIYRDPGDGEKNFLTSSLIVSNWMWREIKKAPSLNYVEHDLEALLDELDAVSEDD